MKLVSENECKQIIMKEQNLNDGTGKAWDWHQSTTSWFALRNILRLLSSIVVGALKPTGSAKNRNLFY